MIGGAAGTISGAAGSEAMLVVGYRAAASRPGRGSYAAFCTSTYGQNGQTWKLVQHQQTPV